MAEKRTPSPPAHATIQPAMYLRVSTNEQADSGLGIDAQRARCTAMCLAKGWEAPIEYKDEGLSGTLGASKRPGLAAMLTAIQAGAVDAVVVLDLSRLARSVKLVTGLIEDLTAARVDFVSCKENFDTSTAMGKAMLGIVAVFGQLERDLTSERTIAALGERGKQYGYKSGGMPLGYYRESGQELITVDGQAAPLVRAILAQRQAGASLRAIAERLNEQHALGRHWYASSVKVIIDNTPRYRGQVDHWPAIL